jgi:hypothetical protein
MSYHAFNIPNLHICQYINTKYLSFNCVLFIYVKNSPDSYCMNVKTCWRLYSILSIFLTGVWWFYARFVKQARKAVESSWNVMAHGDAREGKWRWNWRMKWVVSTLHTSSELGVSNITTADAHTSAASNRLIYGPANLNRLVHFAERRNLVSARVPSHFKRSLRPSQVCP